MKQSLRSAYAIWMRNITIYKRTWHLNILPNFFEPFLYLLGMGLGLGYYVQSGIESQSYITFIGPGLIAAAAMNGATFEVTYNMFVRIHFEKTYQAYLATPTLVKDILYGEIFWAVTRSFIYSVIFIVILAAFGLWGHHIITSPLVFLAPLACLLVGLLFAVIGAFFTSLVNSIDLYIYYFTLFVTPLFLFSGIFFPVDRFPLAAKVAWFTPLYHCVHLMRGLVQGPFGMTHVVSLVWLVVVTVILYAFIPKFMTKKLMD